MAALLSAILAFCCGVSVRAETATTKPSARAAGFKHRGFYLHGGWFFKYPFAVRTWQRADYADMFSLLRQIGYDRVMIWPMMEAIPAPLSEADAKELKAFRSVIDDARAAGLECWLTQCPNLTSPPSIATRPWRSRNPYPVWKSVRLDNPAEAKAYLDHRTAMMAILNNADGYVTIDGDPGGYAGAKPADWLKVFQSDRAAIDRYGITPRQQQAIPWVWCGWGTKGVWQEPIETYVRTSMQLLKQEMAEPWEMLPGRSHLDGHANGRINIALADQLGLIPRSTILCYEAIEFEPTPPTAVLQFNIIRRMLRQEGAYAKTARGVFGNAQQPVTALPNLYFFGRASQDLSYLDRSDDQVLTDFAELLGGPADVLRPAWSCLRLELDQLPADLPAKLRAVRLTGAGRTIPGGPERYVDILARQVESWRGLLEATHTPAASDEEAVARIVDGVTALVNWWKTHGFVMDGSGDEPFEWWFVQPAQVERLQRWAHANVRDRDTVTTKAAELLASRGVLPVKVATARVSGLLR